MPRLARIVVPGCLTDRQLKDVRRYTLTGRPLGSDSFLSKLETAFGRRLGPLPVGRPPKTQGEREREGEIGDCPYFPNPSPEQIFAVARVFMQQVYQVGPMF